MADLTQTSALPLSLPFLVEHAYQTMDLMGEDLDGDRNPVPGEHTANLQGATAC